MFKRALIGAAIASQLAGCATPFMTQKYAEEVRGSRVDKAVNEFVNEKRTGIVREMDKPMADFTPTETPVKRGDVFIKAAGTPFAPIINELGKRAGLSVAFGDGIDPMRKITVDFNGATSDEAIRTTAFLAGYAAVIDKNSRTLFIGETATYNYRLPSGVFRSLQASYSVGGDPSSKASSSGSGSSGGSSGGASSSLKAEFTISGKEGTNGTGLQKFIQDMAGKNSEVLITDQGVVSIKGNAQSLRRVNEFLNGFARDALTQVEIEASVVEVSLTKDFSLGIQWGKVLNGATSGVYSGGSTLATGAITAVGGDTSTLIGSAASAAASGSIGGYRTTANSAQIINALMQFTDVNIVSQPKLVSLNNNPATFFDGTQIPYVGSIQQTAGTTTSTTTTSTTVTGSVSYAIDGVSFSAVPSVVSKNSVQITLMPVLTSVGKFSTFLDGQLTAPTQSNKQTYMRVVAESGKTLILGGIRYNKDTKDTAYGSSTEHTGTSKEVVILLRANVVPPQDVDILMSESL